MRKIIRSIFINFLCFWLIAEFLPAIDYSNNLKILFIASLTLFLFNLLVKPLLNLVFLPINLITLGSFRWVVNIIVLYLVTIFVSGFYIKPFSFSGINFNGFIIPALNFSTFWSFLLVSFLISVISDTINYLMK